MAARNLGAALEQGAGACWISSTGNVTGVAATEESQHLVEAAAWFFKAAMSGDLDAQVHLATMHAQVHKIEAGVVRLKEGEAERDNDIMRLLVLQAIRRLKNIAFVRHMCPSQFPFEYFFLYIRAEACLKANR